MRLKLYFEDAPLKTGTFNHYRPARYLAEHIGDLSKSLSAERLSRFENAFATLNSLIVD
jgi:hypothetical protein